MTTSLENKAQELDVKTTLENMNLPQDQVEDILKAISETTDKLKTQNIELQNLEIQDNLSNLKDNITWENADTRTSISIKMKDKDWKNIWTIDYNVKIRESKVSLNQQNSPSSQIDQNQTPASQPTNQPETSSTTQSDTKPETQPETNTQIDNKIDIYSVNWFMTTLNMLLREIEDTRVWISKKWLSKAWKKTMDAATKKLNQYEKRIKAKKDALEKQIALWVSPQINEIDINYVRQLQSDIDTVRQKDVRLWQRWELSNTAPFLYNSPENARSANRSQESINNFERNLKNEVKDWAILNIFGRQEQAAIDFYRRIAEWRYTQADYNVYKTNENIFNPSFQRCGIATPILVPTYVAWTNPEIWAQTINQVKPQVDYSNMDRWETFQQWWIAWIIDKWLSNCKNMTPGQRETWKSLAVLWWFAAWIYWLFKFYTGKWSFRKKAWITAAVIFWSQALTWEWPLSLYKKFMTWWLSKNEMEAKFGNAFWDAVNWVWNSWIEAANTIAPAMYSMMIFNPSMTVWELNAQTRMFKENPEAWKAFRQEAISKLKNKYWDNSIQHFSATFTDDFDEEKWNARLASFWVTDSTVTTTKIYELANNASMNEIILEKFKEENWLKVRSEKKKELEDYMKSKKDGNQAINIEELKWKESVRFELDTDATFTNRPEDAENINKLTDQVNALSLDDATKADLAKEIKTFYNERTIASKPNLNDFNLKMENWKLILSSRNWHKAEIDITKKELIWFWNGVIRYSRLSHLLNTADIANKILESQKWQTPTWNPIFAYKLERKWICFNSANSIRKDIITRNNSGMDTRVLSTWRGWATSKIEQLCDKPKEFAEYLSKRRLEENQQRLAS